MPNQFTSENRRVPVVVVGPSIAYVELTKGKYSLIDSEDVAIVSSSNWCTRTSKAEVFYAIRRKDNRTQFLHTVVFGNPEGGKVIDHRNGDGLDNRKSNLRFISQQENTWNSKIRASNRSGYMGVCFRKDSRSWKAYINHKGRKVSLGSFKTPEKASAAYKSAALAFRGEGFMRQ